MRIRSIDRLIVDQHGALKACLELCAPGQLCMLSGRRNEHAMAAVVEGPWGAVAVGDGHVKRIEIGALRPAPWWCSGARARAFISLRVGEEKA